jgi:Domain of unknown function (DUF2382)
MWLIPVDVHTCTYEGDTMIVSVLEEVLVVDTRLRLTEALQMTTRQVAHHQPERVTRQREEATGARVPRDAQREDHTLTGESPWQRRS